MVLQFLKGVDWRYWVIIALAAFIVVLRADIAFKNHEIVSLNANLIKEEALNKALSDSLKELTISSDKLRQEMANVAKSNSAIETKTNGILSKISEKKIPNDCPGAMSELQTFSNGFAKEWNSGNK